MYTASHLNPTAGPSRAPTSASSRTTPEDSICATWARDVARATTTITTTTFSQSSNSTSRRVVASAPRASTPASPSSYSTIPPRRGRTTSNGSATSSARSSTTTSTTTTTTTTTATSATSVSTASSGCDTFIASLPAMTMFGSVRPRGGQSLEERHLSIEPESAQVCFARRI